MSLNNSDLKLTLRFDAENKSFIGEVKNADRSLEQLGNTAGRSSRSMRGMSSESDVLSGKLSHAKTQVLALATGFSALQVAQQAASRLAQYQEMRTQITALVGSQQAWAQTEEYLSSVAQEHGKSLLSLSGSYARLLSLENGGLISHKQTIALFEGMSNAASANGATQEQLGQVMYGLQQAMASGTVRAEEFNQVTDPMPALLIEMAKAANTTVGGLRNMVNTGQITSELFGQILVKALARYDGAAARAANNIKGQYAQIQTAYTQAVSAFERPISDSLTPLLTSTAEGLHMLADNADTVTEVVGVAMALSLGRGAAALIAMTRQRVASTLATRTETQAILAKTQAAIAAINTEIAELAIMKSSNAQKFAATGGERALTAALGQRAVMTQAVTVAQAELNVVSRVGSGLMAALGGPVGIAMMAAGAIAYFALQAKGAKTETLLLKDEVEKLTGKFEDLNAAERRIKISQLGLKAGNTRKQLATVSAEIETLTSRLNTLTSAGEYAESTRKINALKAKSKELQNELTKIAAEQKAVFDQGLPKNGWKNPNQTAPENSKAQKSGEKLLDNLKRQIALYGKTSEVAKVRYAIEHGELKGINDELKKQLLLQAKLLDSKKKSKPKTDKIDDYYAASDALNGQMAKRLAIKADPKNKALIEEDYAYTERQEKLQEQFDLAMNQAKGNNELELALRREHHENLEVLEQQHEMNMAEIRKNQQTEEFNARMQSWNLMLGASSQFFDGMAGLAKAFGGEQSKSYRIMFALSKGFAVAQAGMNLMMAISNAEAVTPWYASIPAVLTAASRGAQTLASLKSMGYQGQAHDGINRVPKANEGTWMLKKNEMVLNEEQADNYRWMLEEVRGMKQLQKQVAMNYQSTNQNNVNVEPAPVTVAFVDDPEQINKYLGTDEGERAVMRIVERNKG
ncbi:tape measure protein [Vibrio harveyi]|nr:tape measure protein [Vibrio harveyi]